MRGKNKKQNYLKFFEFVGKFSRCITEKVF
jgi:hypothetical protein